MLENTIVMHKGMCIYEGRTSAIKGSLLKKDYLLSCGPYNVLDWILRISQMEANESLASRCICEDVEMDALQVQTSAKKQETPTPPTNLNPSDINDWYSKQSQFELEEERKKRTEAHDYNRISIISETYELLRRGHNLKRNKVILQFRLFVLIFLHLLMAVCFWGVGEDSLEIKRGSNRTQVSFSF